MEITAWEQNVRWVEHGRWHGLEVTLDLVFVPLSEDRTRVRATTEATARGLAAPARPGAGPGRSPRCPGRPAARRPALLSGARLC